jgi:hypothetical protein
VVAGRLLVRHGPARLARSLQTVAREIRGAAHHAATWRPVVLSSPIVCAGLVGMFLLAARAAGVDAGPTRLLPLAFIVLIAAGLPLNVGGWGPREGVAAWVFAGAGAGAAQGVAVAGAFGVLRLVATLPGLVVLFLEGRAPADPARSRRRAARRRPRW